MNRSVLERWASLGMYVVGGVHSQEDPEVLVMDTVTHMREEARLLEVLVTWISNYGHLLLTKKLHFQNMPERRLFSAIVETSETKEAKLLRFVHKEHTQKKEHLYPSGRQPCRFENGPCRTSFRGSQS